jgi:hypothetical protein
LGADADTYPHKLDERDVEGEAPVEKTHEKTPSSLTYRSRSQPTSRTPSDTRLRGSFVRGTGDEDALVGRGCA